MEKKENGKKEIELQVLIVTFGRKGILDVASEEHPAVPGVEYLIGWQIEDPHPHIPAALVRPDVKILTHSSRGVAANRQFLLDMATAPVAILADDDLSYSAKALRAIIDSFKKYPDCGLIAFKYSNRNWSKQYPDVDTFDLRHPAKGWYLTAFELAFRPEMIKKANIRFNLNFGVGAPYFPACEEDLFLNDALRAGIKGRFLNITVCRHRDEPTTGIREAAVDSFIRTKGAAFTRLYPLSWPLRMITNALRQNDVPLWKYVRYWIHGIVMAHRLKVFNDTDNRR